MLRWFLCLLLAATAQAGTYYVSSSAGNDSNNGTSAATAWKTLAKVNASSFLPGDRILLKRGDVWRESLIPPSSGSTGNPISFDAYGNGAPPTITGYLEIASASWTQVSGNLWSGPVPASGVNYVLFGTIWGQKQSSQAAVQHARDFYFASNTLFVYSPENPAIYYGNVAVILLSGSSLIYVNGKSWLQFQHILLNWFDSFGVQVTGNSDHLVFANIESDGMVPAGVLPHGFYVNASPAAADIKFINSEAHLNYDGFRFDGSLSSATLINCKAYVNRNAGLDDNTSGHVSYSYSHFYANDIAILNSQDVYGGIDAGNNLSGETAPEVFWFARYPARITFTVDDEGKSPGGGDFVASILPEFDSRGLKLSMAVVTGEQYAAADIPRIQGWVSAGHDINSHSWSHNYYTTPNMVSIRYTGTGNAASMSIAGNRLTTNVSGGPGGENLDLDLTSPPYDEYTELVGVINGRPGYSASLIGLPHGHSITLADVSGADIKTAAFTVPLQKDKFVPDEMSTSKAWLQANVAGLGDVKVYVYPSGYEDAQTQGWAVSAGYEGGRGGLSMGLGNKELYQSGANLQDITSLSISGLHGMSEAQAQAKIMALVFKASAWGAPYGLFCHPGELTPAEVGYILDGLIEGRARVMSNSSLATWLASTSNITGTTYYVSPASGPVLNLKPTKRSPSHHRGSDQGADYAVDIAGVLRPVGAWDIGAYQNFYQVHGTIGSSGWAKYGFTAGSLCGPPTYGCSRTDQAVTLAPTAANAPNVGNLTGLNTTVTDPDFGNTITRVSDAAMDPTWHGTFVATASGSADENLWNTDSTMFILQHVNTAGYPMAWNGETKQASRVYTSQFPSTGGMKLDRGGIWSRANRNILYLEPLSGTPQVQKLDFTNWLSGDQATPPPAAIAYDFSGTNCLGTSFNNQWTTSPGLGKHDEMGIGFSTTSGQGSSGAIYAAVYVPGKGCALLNTNSHAISADPGFAGGGLTCGSNGCTGTANTTHVCTIHNVKMSLDGNWMIIAYQNCSVGDANVPDFWQVGTTNVTTPSGNLSGHWTEGYSHWMNNSKQGSPIEMNTRLFSTPSSSTRLLQTSGFPAIIGTFDTHFGWNNADANDTYPWFWTEYASATPVGGNQPFAWWNEVKATSPIEGMTWRFAHTYNTGQSQRFSTQYAIGSISQDGKWFLLSSDWMGKLGSESNQAACTLGSDCRGDVFVVELK